MYVFSLESPPPKPEVPPVSELGGMVHTTLRAVVVPAGRVMVGALV